MDREPDADSTARPSTARSIVTITERQTLSIDMSLTSTDMFPAVFVDDKNSSRTALREKYIDHGTRSIRGEEDAPPPLVVPPVPEYLSGFKLFLVLTCVTVVCWLTFLDSSMIVTVGPSQLSSRHDFVCENWGADMMKGHSSNH